MLFEFYSHAGQAMAATKAAYRDFMISHNLAADFISSNSPRLVIDGVQKCRGYCETSSFMHKFKRAMDLRKLGANEAIKVVDDEINTINLGRCF